MSERRKHNPPEGENELTKAELGREAEKLIKSFKDVLKETPEVQRVLLNSLFEDRQYSQGAAQEGMIYPLGGLSGIVFLKGESSYTVRIDGPADTENKRTLEIERVSLIGDLPDYDNEERLMIRTAKAENSSQFLLARIVYESISDRQYFVDDRSAIYGARRLLNKLGESNNST